MGKGLEQYNLRSADYSDIFSTVIEERTNEYLYVGSGNFSNVYQAEDSDGNKIIVKVTNKPKQRSDFLSSGVSLSEERTEFGLRSTTIAVTDNSILGSLNVQSSIENWNEQHRGEQEIRYVRTLGFAETEEVVIEILENVEMLDTFVCILLADLVQEVRADREDLTSDDLFAELIPIIREEMSPIGSSPSSVSTIIKGNLSL